MGLNYIDWTVIVVYLAGMIGLAVYLSRGQEKKEDYYLGGNDTSAWAIAISTMATQCSTNSLLGAPAFVILTGLVWLQYEIAVPLAMIVLMAFMLPLLRSLNIISVYSYLEDRFGVGTRTVLSVLFQFLRAFSTGVTVYGISLVITLCMGIEFWQAVLLLGIVTVIYDTIGGMKAVILSDVIQMFILYGSIAISIYVALQLVGSPSEVLELFGPERMKAVDFAHTGLGDGKTFAFWPMLFGGFFLYVAYYGCDQTQVQRELSTKSADDTNQSLFLNGVLRFPLVLTYCVLGVCIAAFLVKNPDFANLLPVKNEAGDPNYNMVVPVFVSQYFPHGLIGLVMVGLFAAAMSSLDSTINSLSATSMQDIVLRFFPTKISEARELFLSKALTVFWGALCVIFAFFVGDISDSIIESINKIGSLINGPILAVFLMGLLTRRVNGQGAVSGLLVGFLGNLYLWVYMPSISWLWWNVIGFFATFIVGVTVSLAFPKKELSKDKILVWSSDLGEKIGMTTNWTKRYWFLGAYALFIVVVISMF